MNTKHIMSPNSLCFIEPCSYHHPFTSPYATIDLSSTSSPTQITNHPLVTPPILTNHITPTNSPYQAPTLHVNVGSQPYTFPNPLDHAQLRHFPPPILLVPIVGHDHTPQPPPKILCPTYGHQFISRGLVHRQCSYQTTNSSNPNPCDHLGSIPSLTPTSPAYMFGHVFQHWMSLNPSI
jgi:hypothetical protein